MTEPEAMSLAACERLAETLRTKGLQAYVGTTWDGGHDCPDPLFWYLYPRGRGGIGVCVTYDRVGNMATQDAGCVAPEHVEEVLRRAVALPSDPDRMRVWAALEAKR